MKNFWKTQEPNFVNDLGIKWYIDELVTQYCLKENISGVFLDNVLAYVVVLPDGNTDRVLVDVNKQEVIYSTKSLEEIGVEIDKLKLLKSYEKKNN